MVLVTVHDVAIVLGLGPSYDKCETFSPSTGTWTQLHDMPFGRRAFAAVAIADKLYVFAGDSKDCSRANVLSNTALLCQTSSC